jgi:CheY-like chemotaxis protein
MDRLLAGQRILVVEDEMMILMSIEDTLVDAGCETVAAAATVDEALALIEGHNFDAAMLDVNLHGSPSYPVADALVARGVPFFFATGYGDHGIKEEYRGQPFVRKPFGHETVIDMFASLLMREDATSE